MPGLPFSVYANFRIHLISAKFGSVIRIYVSSVIRISVFPYVLNIRKVWFRIVCYPFRIVPYRPYLRIVRYPYLRIVRYPYLRIVRFVRIFGLRTFRPSGFRTCVIRVYGLLMYFIWCFQGFHPPR